jgi:uncharacterized membrane protein YfcA
MTPLDTAVLAVLILLAAALYASVGHGGASGYLAAMALVGLAPAVMRPTALALNVLVALIGTAAFQRAGRIPWRLLVPLLAASVPAAFAGGALQLPAGLYRKLLGVVLLLAAWRLLRRDREPEAPRPPRAATLLAWGALIGLVAGLTGVGGGIFLSPLLVLRRWSTVREAAGAAAPFILVNSLGGIAGLVAAGGAIPAPAPLWAAAAAVGGSLGAWYGSRRSTPLALLRLLAVVLVVAALKMLLA